MSIYKPLVIDSSKGIGDSTDFTINIHKNFFNKAPTSIRLLDYNVPVDVVFINESNNKFQIDLYADDGSIINSFQGYITPTLSMNQSEFCAYFTRQFNTFLNGLYLGSTAIFTMDYIYNDGLIRKADCSYDVLVDLPLTIVPAGPAGGINYYLATIGVISFTTTQALPAGTGLHAFTGTQNDIGKSIILVAQTNPALNGIYQIVDVGSASTPYILIRRDDSNNVSGIIRSGTVVYVNFADEYYQLQTSLPINGIDTVAQTWVKLEQNDVTLNAFTVPKHVNVNTGDALTSLYDYFVLYQLTAGNTRIGIDFNIPNSIGPLLGFGKRKLSPFKDLYVESSNYVTGTTTQFYRSYDKIIDFSKINSIVYDLNSYVSTNNAFLIGAVNNDNKNYYRLGFNGISFTGTFSMYVNDGLIQWLCAELTYKMSALPQPVTFSGRFRRKTWKLRISSTLIKSSDPSSHREPIDFNFNCANGLGTVLGIKAPLIGNVFYEIDVYSTGIANPITTNNCYFQAKGSKSNNWQTFAVPVGSYLFLQYLYDAISVAMQGDPTSDRWDRSDTGGMPASIYPDADYPSLLPTNNHSVVSTFDIGTGIYGISFSYVSSNTNMRLEFSPNLQRIFGFTNEKKNRCESAIIADFEVPVLVHDVDADTFTGSNTGGYVNVSMPVDTANNTWSSIVMDGLTIHNTSALVSELNRRLAPFNVLYSYNVVFGYDTNIRTYYFKETTGKVFCMDFSTPRSMASTIGFDFTTYLGLSEYHSKQINLVEKSFPNINVHICSDLTSNIDGGSIVPAGGNIPLPQVLFTVPLFASSAQSSAIPNVDSSLDSPATQPALIGTSKLALAIRNNQYDSNGQVGIRFYLNLSSGLGFTPVNWYMRTQLGFATINN